MTTKTFAALGLAALAVLALAMPPRGPALPSARAQEEGSGRAVPGRFAASPPLGRPNLVATLDTYTGVIYLSEGEPGAGTAIVLDLPNARASLKPIAKDMSGGGVVILPALPNPPGVGAPAFAWSPSQGEPLGILDTRSGIHWALEGAWESGKVHRTDLRLSTRGSRELHLAK